MNEKGSFIASTAGLALLQAFTPVILILSGLFIAGIVFTFAKSLAVASILGVVSAYLMWKSVTILDTKQGQLILVGALVIMSFAIFFGVTQPMTIAGFDIGLTKTTNLWQGAIDYIDTLVSVFVR